MEDIVEAVALEGFGELAETLARRAAPPVRPRRRCAGSPTRTAASPPKTRRCTTRCSRAPHDCDSVPTDTPAPLTAAFAELREAVAACRRRPRRRDPHRGAVGGAARTDHARAQRPATPGPRHRAHRTPRRPVQRPRARKTLRAALPRARGVYVVQQPREYELGGPALQGVIHGGVRYGQNGRPVSSARASDGGMFRMAGAKTADASTKCRGGARPAACRRTGREIVTAPPMLRRPGGDAEPTGAFVFAAVPPTPDASGTRRDRRFPARLHARRGLAEDTRCLTRTVLREGVPTRSE